MHSHCAFVADGKLSNEQFQNRSSASRLFRIVLDRPFHNYSRHEMSIIVDFGIFILVLTLWTSRLFALRVTRELHLNSELENAK